MRHKPLALLIGAMVLASAGASAWFWLKAQHSPADAIAVASEFAAHLQAKQLSSAYELTIKSGYVGRDMGEFEAISRRQACEVHRVVGTSPFQSNGNRLRRRMSGAVVDPPEISVEFEGSPCLLRITVRRVENNRWRVSGFATHAG